MPRLKPMKKKLLPDGPTDPIASLNSLKTKQTALQGSARKDFPIFLIQFSCVASQSDQN